MSSSETNSANPNPSDGNWTVVTKRRNRNHPKRAPYPNPNSRLPQPPIQTPPSPRTPTPWTPYDLDSQPDPLRQTKLNRMIQTTLDKFAASKFRRHFLSQLRSPQIQSPLASLGPEIHLVIYGIGSVESFEVPRLQLSLALLLRQEFGASLLSSQVFDPVLSSAECAAMEDLGISVMRFDESGRREVKAATLFFMPHCDIELYDNLLEANWGSDRMKKMAILGNSFGWYKRSAEVSRGSGLVTLEDMGPRVMAAGRFVTEVKIDGGGWEKDGVFGAFHDMSWHFFESVDDGCDFSIA